MSTSFRTQLTFLLLVPLLLGMGALGLMAWRQASDSLEESALRAVGIAANARKQALALHLQRRQERLQARLGVALLRCSEPGAAPSADCLRTELAQTLQIEGATAVRCEIPGVPPISLGEGAETLSLEPLPAPQLARFAGTGTRRPYEMVVRQEGATLAARFGPAFVESIFADRYGLGAKGETFLVDAEGLFVTPPRYPGPQGTSHPIDARPMEACLAGRDAEMRAPDYRGVGVIHAFRFVPEIGGGCIMAHVAQEDAFAPVRALRSRMLLAGVAGVLLAMTLAALFSERLVRSVARLTNRARELEAGAFAQPVPVGGPRELRTLGTSFRSLADSLRASQAAAEAERSRLELLASFSGALAESRFDIGVVLDTSCRHLAERIGDACLARLLSADGRWLERRTGHARDREVERELEQLLREAPAHGPAQACSILESGVRLLAEIDPGALGDLEQALPPEVLALLARRPASSLAVLPLSTPDRCLGLLVLVRFEGGAPYPAEDAALLQELADRAALAVESAQLYADARQAVQIREDVVGIVGHDLRNPLTAIALSASMLLRREKLPEAQARSLQRIASAAARAARLTTDLLDFTQARVGRLPVKTEPVELHALARHVVDEVQAAHPERTVHLRAAGEAMVEGDPGRLAQVLANLLGNALQHSPPETPVLASVRTVGAEHLVEIHNLGEPIPSDLLPMLFEPFRRGVAAGAGAGGSVGLGLFISRSIVEAHGGRIEVQSTAADGTTFRVRLPALGI